MCNIKHMQLLFKFAVKQEKPIKMKKTILMISAAIILLGSCKKDEMKMNPVVQPDRTTDNTKYGKVYFGFNFYPKKANVTITFGENTLGFEDKTEGGAVFKVMAPVKYHWRALIVLPETTYVKETDMWVSPGDSVTYHL